MAPPPRRPKKPAPPPEPTTTEPSMPAVDPDTTDQSPAHVPPERALASTPRRPPVARRERRIPTSRDEPKKSPVLKILLVLMVLGVGGAVAWKKFLQPPPKPKAIDPHIAEVQEATQVFQDGKNLVRKLQWKAALEQFNKANELAPELEGLKGYLEAAEREIPNQQHLDACAAALDKKQVGPAWKELAMVPEATQQLTRRQELQTRIGKTADERLKEATKLTSGKLSKAEAAKLKALADDVLVARPTDREAMQFRDQANRVLGWKPAVEKPPDPGDPAAAVMSIYSGGDTTAAYAKADECAGESPRCARLKEQLTEAIALFKKVESLDAPELEKAVRLDKAIAGGKLTPNGKNAGVRLGGVLLPKASSAAARKTWGYAIATANKILEGDPGNAAAKNIVSDGRQAAQELYQRCYVGRQATPDDSLPLCKEVVEMLPEGDELREKAKRILEGTKPP